MNFIRKNSALIKRILPVIFVVLVMVVSFTMCSKREESPATEPEESLAVTETPGEAPPSQIQPTETPESPPYDGPYSPLTGLPCDTDISGIRPIAIMINNLKVAQPQLGISRADIIYEVPVEGGLTRMLAIFGDVSDVGVIGSIRSSRHYFIDLAQGHDAVYIHAGGSPQAYTALANRNITRLDGVNGSKTDIFYRDAQRRKAMGYEHSMVTTGELITKFLPTYGFRLEHTGDYVSPLKFTENAAPQGEGVQPALDFRITFSSSKSTGFTYNTADGKYYISQHGGAYTDGNDGTQVSAANVIILKTSVTRIPGDTEGRLNVKLTGSGSGYFVSGGSSAEITWSKKSESAPLVYTLSGGDELTLARGVTYVCIIPTENTVSIT